MTALTAVYDAKRKDGKLVQYPLGSAKKIYKGGLVVLASSGGAQPAADAASVTFVGVAYETVDNTAGSLNSISVRISKTGVFTFNKATAGLSDLGKIAYAIDDNTVALSSTNSVAVGTVVGVPDGSHVQVRIDGKVA